MSILIKGMEMPTEGEYHMTLYACGDGVAYVDVAELPADEDRFDAVPVPPHGRLIDVDDADEYAYDELELANTYLTGWEAARAMQKIYHADPTIIPAEEKTDAACAGCPEEKLCHEEATERCEERGWGDERQGED